jgi:hypothetical protein
MKITNKVTYCEHCDKPIILVSPPLEEQYEHGLICIKEGSILLPSEIVENCSHSKDISGYYCDLSCLNWHISKILLYPMTKRMVHVS